MMTWRKNCLLGIVSFLIVVSSIAFASGPTQLGFKTSLTVAADTQRVKSMVVTEILPGSLAGKAGLRAGDEILELNGRKVQGALIQNLWREKQSIQPEDVVRLRIRHADGVSEMITFAASKPIVA